MTRFFLDTSAVVKRYLPEIGTAWVRRLSNPASGNTIVLSEITLVEVASALAARHRAPRGISRRACNRALTLFRRHFATE